MKQLNLLIAFIIIISAQAIAQKSYTVIGVGDIMLGTDFPEAKYLPKGNDCTPLLANVKDTLLSADITFGNLEGAFSDGAPVTKSCKDPSVCYAFRTPTKYFNCLIESGFDIFSLANNHSFDLGTRGQESTTKLIDNAGLKYAGLLNHKTSIVVKDGIRYGLAAFSPNNGTCRINNYTEAQKIISELAAETDITIVSFHGGAEGSKHQHVPRKNEIFYGENRGDVYEFARLAIDAGADIIFGQGPHVVRAIDIYKDRFIAYSLGNFCTYSRMNIDGVNALAPIAKVYVDKTGKFEKAQIISAKQIKNQGTFIDPEEKAYNKIKELTKVDIPELKIKFEKNGWISRE